MGGCADQACCREGGRQRVSGQRILAPCVAGAAEESPSPGGLPGRARPCGETSYSHGRRCYRLVCDIVLQCVCVEGGGRRGWGGRGLTESIFVCVHGLSRCVCDCVHLFVYVCVCMCVSMCAHGHMYAVYFFVCLPCLSHISWLGMAVVGPLCSL